MFRRPNRRAFSHRSSPFLVAMVRAIRFHAWGELSTQNRATWVWSAVRALGVVTPSPPRRLTSLKSLAYRFDVTAYGGPGRNCELEFKTNGVTSDQPGANAKSEPGVNRYSPGRVPCGYALSNSSVSEPSAFLARRMAAAAASPTASPRIFARPLGMASMAAAYSASTPSTTFFPVTQSENGGGSCWRRGTSTPRAA